MVRLDERPEYPLTLGLPIEMPGVKPAGAMKTLSRTFAAVVLAVIATLALANYFTTHIIRNQQFLLYLGIKPIIGPPTYVYWTTESAFDDALKQVCSGGGTYVIRKLKAEGQTPYDAKPCKEMLKTVKVTKSNVADDAGAAASAGNDPNVVYKVAAARVEDVMAVLGALATPTPTPTH